PLINYNLHAAPGDDSLTILRNLHQGGDSTLHYDQVVKQELKNTFLVSIPTITGNPFCPVSEEPILKEPNSPPSTFCTLVRGGWSLGYLLLFACAGFLATLAAWRSTHQWRSNRDDPSARQQLVRDYARWLLLACALITLLLYTFSNGPLDWPGTHARYLIALLVAWPAVLWPLWSAISAHSTGLWKRARQYTSTALLLGIGLVYLTATFLTLSEIPGTQAEHQRDLALINHLRSIGVRHFYTEYWTCDKLAFLSQEELICGVVASNLKPTHNREAGYYQAVSADPHAAYVFPIGYHTPTLEHNIAKYHFQTFAGYHIYIPIT
ncbi:MAG: hypothetical protein J2P36_06595, partial [Ktedonobacteraceae bacterium]|nr:hypothetical protein [Ktedonobacteraceae bacterium]